MAQKHNFSLTEGPVAKSLFWFALPLFGSALIQQLYNTVDLIFVGQLLDNAASVAVGSSSLLVTCLVGFFTGLGVGVSIIAARAFGAKDRVMLFKTVHNAAGLALIGGVLLTIIGLLFSPVFLRCLNTPEEVMEPALVYLRIYFFDIIAIIFYNISAGLLRAMGEARRPMLYQLWGGLLNVAVNALLTMVVPMGVAGVAIGTLAGQSLAAVLTVWHLCRLQEDFRLQIRFIRLQPAVCLQIFAIGIPAGVQAMVTTLSNLIVQSQINNLEVLSIAAFTAYFKVENFVYLPILAMGQAVTTFVGQNLGAGQEPRARLVLRRGVQLGVLITLVIGFILVMFSDLFFGIFNKDPNVQMIGRQIGLVTFPLYFTYVFVELLSGALRGAGHAIPPMALTLLCMCVLRVIILFYIMSVAPVANIVAWIYPITWIVNSLAMFVYYKLHFGRPVLNTV